MQKQFAGLSKMKGWFKNPFLGKQHSSWFLFQDIAYSVVLVAWKRFFPQYSRARIEVLLCNSRICTCPLLWLLCTVHGYLNVYHQFKKNSYI